MPWLRPWLDARAARRTRSALEQTGRSCGFIVARPAQPLSGGDCTRSGVGPADRRPFLSSPYASTAIHQQIRHTMGTSVF